MEYSTEDCPKTLEDLPKFREMVLNIHNEYRARHASPPLQLDEQLNKIAQQFAEELLEIDPEDIQNEIIPPYGSNVYFGYVRYQDRDVNYIERVLEDWYEQRRCYNYTGKMLPGNLMYTRNFTQLVWKDSRFLGVGVVSHPKHDYKDVFVCIYNPPGNIDGEFERNVTPPKDEDVELSPEQQRELRELEESKDDRVLWPELKRLYAVPEEKVRVWAVWLSRVCEIADEWQGYLRSNVELMTSMAEQMREARRFIAEKEPKEVDILPKDEDKIRLWEEFPRQADLYRTYYKHWREIGGRASAHIANRPVTAGRRATTDDEDGSAAAPDAPQPPQYSMTQTESAVAQPTEETATGIDPATDAPERAAPPDDQSEVAEPRAAEETGEAKSAEREKTGEDSSAPETEPTTAGRTEGEAPTEGETAAAIEAAEATGPSVPTPPPEIAAAPDPEVGIKKRKAAEKLIQDTGDFNMKEHQSYPGFFYLRSY